MEWSKRCEACSIRLKPKFKEKIYIYIYLVKEKRDNHKYIYYRPNCRKFSSTAISATNELRVIWVEWE